MIVISSAVIANSTAPLPLGTVTKPAQVRALAKARDSAPGTERQSATLHCSGPLPIATSTVNNKVPASANRTPDSSNGGM
jgi:hypothetical protein